MSKNSFGSIQYSGRLWRASYDDNGNALTKAFRSRGMAELYLETAERDIKARPLIDATCRQWQNASAVRSVVYFLRREDGIIKIGYSENVAARKASLETGAGPLTLLATVQGGESEEGHIHRMFAASRVWPNLEWFHPSSDLLEFISNARMFQNENPL